MSLMKLIAKYDRENEEYIRELQDENKALRAKVSELSILAFDGAIASDRMKLELILTGCLTRPADTAAAEKTLSDMREVRVENPTTG